MVTTTSSSNRSTVLYVTPAAPLLPARTVVSPLRLCQWCLQTSSRLTWVTTVITSLLSPERWICTLWTPPARTLAPPGKAWIASASTTPPWWSWVTITRPTMAATPSTVPSSPLALMWTTGSKTVPVMSSTVCIPYIKTVLCVRVCVYIKSLCFCSVHHDTVTLSL